MRTVFVLLVIGVTACSDGTSPNLGDEIELDYGQLKILTGKDFSAKFEAVAEDSRCPIGVDCFWAGNAKILLRVSSTGLSEVYSLNTTLEPKQIEINGYVLELVSVTPDPVWGNEMTYEDYSITISITQ